MLAPILHAVAVQRTSSASDAAKKARNMAAHGRATTATNPIHNDRWRTHARNVNGARCLSIMHAARADRVDWHIINRPVHDPEQCMLVYVCTYLNVEYRNHVMVVMVVVVAISILCCCMCVRLRSQNGWKSSNALYGKPTPTPLRPLHADAV